MCQKQKPVLHLCNVSAVGKGRTVVRLPALTRHDKYITRSQDDRPGRDISAGRAQEEDAAMTQAFEILAAILTEPRSTAMRMASMTLWGLTRLIRGVLMDRVCPSQRLHIADLWGD